MSGRVLRRGAALVVAVVAVACVLAGWLEEPGPLDAAGAIAVTRAAFDHAGVDAEVDDVAIAGVYDPKTGTPVAVFTTSATVDGVPIHLYLRQSDAEPVYIDDHRPTGGNQLSDVVFTRFVGGLENPARHDLRVRNLLLTVGAAVILAVAVLSLTLNEPEPR